MSEEVKYSFEEVLSLTQKVTGVIFNIEDLDIKEGETPGLDHVISFARHGVKAKIDKEYDKGRKKASEKLEKALKQKLKNVSFKGDTTELLIDDVSEYIQGLSKSSKEVTYEQALSNPKLQEEYKALKQKATDYESLEQKHSNYKFNMSVLDVAKAFMNKNNYNLSSNSNRRAKQIKQILDEISEAKFKRTESGGLFLDSNSLPIVLNEDGEQRMKELGEPFTFSDWIENASPVDFVAKQDNQKPSTPPPAGGSGFTFDKSKVSHKDYVEAKESGQTAKAEAIKKVIFERK